jgi:hypothetical protein
MDINELAARLDMLESANMEQAAMQEQRGFIDKYGTMFSGDEGIGMAILAELNRRGISAAAVGADRAVQEVLDQIRMEAAAVLDKIKADRDTVNSLVEQVQDVQEAVAAATGAAAPGNGIFDVPPMPPVGPEASVPLPVDAGAMPPLEGEIPPTPETLPPPLPTEVPGAPAPTEIPPEAIPSDVRVKMLRQRVSDYRAKNIVKPAVAPKPATSAKPTWRPQSSILSAIKGGI